MVEPGHTERYTFTPKPTGTRWYHSHDMAGPDLRRSLYSGMYGSLVIEPANDPGRYDREILLAAHHWEPRSVSMQDIRRLTAATVSKCSTLLRPSTTDTGPGDRPRARRRASAISSTQCQPDENIMLAMPATASLWWRSTAIRWRHTHRRYLVPRSGGGADMIVTMDNPGVWILGGVKDEDRSMGLGTVIEYANRDGEPQWLVPKLYGMGLHDLR